MTRYALSDHESVEVIATTPQELLVEARYLPGAAPPPLHWHPAQTERFEVLEGTLAVTIGEEERLLLPGHTLEVPPQTVHRMWNPDQVQTLARWSTTPAMRTESWFARISALHDRHASGLLDLVVAAREYRDVFVPAIRPAFLAGPAVATLAAIGRMLGRGRA
ncbi:MAG TPA: cupin domain-containing protein [Microbacteriaceae bacterium]|jgi:mannose-6-phosphate isomerase-like protein (cupin superfamily)|nr:cupin domain-containing protein [Microbacteriaceae bacterium]